MARRRIRKYRRKRRFSKRRTGYKTFKRNILKFAETKFVDYESEITFPPVVGQDFYSNIIGLGGEIP